MRAILYMNNAHAYMYAWNLRKKCTNCTVLNNIVEIQQLTQCSASP